MYLFLSGGYDKLDWKGYNISGLDEILQFLVLKHKGVGNKRTLSGVKTRKE